MPAATLVPTQHIDSTPAASQSLKLKRLARKGDK